MAGLGILLKLQKEVESKGEGIWYNNWEITGGVALKLNIEGDVYMNSSGGVAPTGTDASMVGE